ncbi:MAG: hypothetical protein Kow0063_43660 [Anaerolineae bacterium]
MRLSIVSENRLPLRLVAIAMQLALMVAGSMPLAQDVAAQAGGDATGIIVFQTASGGPIYTVTPDGGDLRYLTTGMDPVLSPDGQQVAFTRWEGSGYGAPGGLWVINVDGSGERLVLGDLRQPKSPVWSPDGTRIAISLQQGGRLEPEYRCTHSLPTAPIKEEFEDIRVVVDVDPDGDVETRFCYTLLPHPFWGLRLVDVTSGQFEDLPHDLFSYAPTWDPANDWRLVYDGELGLVNLDLTRSEGATWPLTDDPNDHTPVFSPDGRMVAVSYWQHDHWEIHTMNAGGGGRARLTKTPLRAIVEARINGQEGRAWNNVAPAWSPDGSQIVFLTDRAGRWEIWTMGADGSHQRPLLSPQVQDQLEIDYDSVYERVLSWR